MSTQTYNGFQNWETWNLALWFDNDEGLYTAKQELIERYGGHLEGERVEAFVLDLLPNGTPDFTDYETVNWNEIARSWSNESDPEPQVDTSASLHCYFSGNGALNFVWQDDDNQATGRTVTLQEALDYLEHNEDGQRRREQGWKAIELSGTVLLVKQVKRIDETTLEIDGDRYTVIVAPPDAEATEIRDYRLTVTTVHAGVTFEVKSISLRPIILFFLNHEALLAELLK